MKKANADLLRAQAVANSLIEEYSIDEPPIPILFILHQEGLEAVAAEFEEAMIISGLLDLEKHQIIVNKADPAEFRALTIARALGHWILHKEELSEIPELKVIYQHSLGGKAKSFYEKEAFCFAAHLLVPQKFLSGDSQLAQSALAVKYQVPSVLIKMRLNEFR